MIEINVTQPPFANYDWSRMKNMYTDLVLGEVGALLETGEMCDCTECVLDVVAIALNSLPPAYWVSGQYNAFTSPATFLSDARNCDRAKEAVKRAVRLVQRNPHH